MAVSTPPTASVAVRPRFVSNGDQDDMMDTADRYIQVSANHCAMFGMGIRDEFDGTLYRGDDGLDTYDEQRAYRDGRRAARAFYPAKPVIELQHIATDRGQMLREFGEAMLGIMDHLASDGSAAGAQAAVALHQSVYMPIAAERIRLDSRS